MNNSTRKCKKDYCEKVFIKNQESFMKKFFKTVKMKPPKVTEKQQKELIQNCMKGYCNPGCKKTIFQDGKQFPKDVVIKTKNKSVKAFATKIIKGMRKEMFGKKSSILKDNFYEKLTAKTVKDIKKNGGLSGCTVAVFK